MNPDGNMTDDQERLSQRGLSFHEDGDLPEVRRPSHGGDDNQLLLPVDRQ